MDYVLNLMLLASLSWQRPLKVAPSTLLSEMTDIIDRKNLPENLPARLAPTEIRLRMLQLPDWTTDGKTLFYNRAFDNFVEAISFVNSLVVPAEQLGHHPDITINYNRVFLSVTTHDAGGLTKLDFQLATTISQL